MEISSIKVNWSQIQERKDKIIQQLRQGMELALKGVDIFRGEAQFVSSNTLKVGQDEIRAKNILVASGSKPLELKELKFQAGKILSSDDILNLKEIPASLLIIGGGVIGCEFASLFSSLGAQVTVIELMPQLLPGQDKEVAKKLELSFKKKGIEVRTNTDAKTIDLKNYALALLCIGRTVDAQSLGLDKAGVKTEKGKIIVDEYLKTNIPHIYAAGDCTGKIMLAHFAAYQGQRAAENIACPDNPKKADNTNVSNCIFTDPEIATVGRSEEEAKNQGQQVRIHKFDFLSSGMARIMDETEGFIKIVSEEKSGEILGAAIIGPKATELIGILTLAVSCQLKVSQLQETIFAHPTLSESIGEALKE
jgi:dihydrolipoamide dehydrogenase